MLRNLRPSACRLNENKALIRCAKTDVSNQKSEVLNLKNWTEIPGPPSYAIIGQLLSFLPGGTFGNKKGYEIFDALYKNYGPIVRLKGLFGRQDMIFLYDAESVAQVFRSENHLPIRPGFQSMNYYKSTYKQKKYGKKFKTGLTVDGGEEWKEFRSIVNPVLMQPKTIKLYENVINEVAKDMIERIKYLRDEEDMIKDNFDTEMKLWSLESIAVVALGGRLNCFDANLPEDSSVRKLIQAIHNSLDIVEELDLKPSLWMYYPTKAYKRAMRYYEEQERRALEFINIAREKFQGKNKLDEEKGVLEKLLEINEEVAVITAIDMISAGVDTTSNTILSTIYLLSKNPTAQEKLRKEVLMKKDKKYLKACIKESIRLMPVVMGNMRRVTKDHIILGYKIPKGLQIGFAHQYMARMESHFPKPNEYIPDRWIVGSDDPLHYGQAHPFAHQPFGFGVRACIGRRIVELELEIFLSRLIENFRLEWIGPEPKINAKVLNYFEGPFGFKFKDLENIYIRLYLLCMLFFQYLKVFEKYFIETKM